ncbi:ABC transporter permease [Candidatus Pacearchaeota archaeon]|nr:ABC transporter permease [Candidatus Pacearchaeota archaeon]
MEIKSLFEIIKKNFVIFGRSKISAFAIILAPFLIVLFATFAFNSSGLSGVVVATYSDSYSDLTNNILTGFEEQNFAVNKLSSQNECIDYIKLNKAQICVIFPKDLSIEGSVEEVIFHVDHSRINLAYSLIHEVELKISSKASTLGVALAQNLIDALQSARDSLPLQKTEISESISQLKEINEKAGNSPATNISLIIEYLNEADSLLDDVEGEEAVDAQSEITTAIESLETIQNSNSQVSSNLKEIQIQSAETNAALRNININLDGLINTLNNINVLEAEKIVSPIKTKIKSINSSTNHNEYLLPTILSLISLFGGVLLSSTLVLRERKTKAYFRNFITPTKDVKFILGAYLTCLIILLVQFALVLAGIQWIVGIDVLSSIGSISLILFISLTLFIFLGMLIGYLFKSDEATILGAVLISAVLMFLSNTILPVETIYGNFRRIAMFNPLVVSNSILKKVILFGINLSEIWVELGILTGFVLGLGLLTYVSLKIAKRRL